MYIAKLKSLVLMTFLSIILAFIFCNPAYAEASKFYQLDLLYKQGKLELKTLTVFPGSISQAPQDGDYKFELKSFTGSVLYSNHFQISSSITVDIIDPVTGNFTAKTIKQDNAEAILNIPYFSNGKQINIYDSSNEMVIGIPVLQFAKTCGDNICQPHEAYESCPADCPPVGKMTSQKIKGTSLSVYLIVGIAVVVVGFGAFVYRRIKRRKKLIEY